MNGFSSAWLLHCLSHALRLIGLLSLAAVTGCFAPELKTIPAPSKERVSEIKKSVATLLGLQPRTDLKLPPCSSLYRNSPQTLTTQVQTAEVVLFDSARGPV